MTHITSGVDLIEIDRVARAIERWGERFIRRVYTDGEAAYCHGRPERFAGRFAAKEAVSKALGVGIRRLRWRDIEILPQRSGKPIVSLYGRAEEVAHAQGVVGLEVSISHSRTDAIAFVVAWTSST